MTRDYLRTILGLTLALVLQRPIAAASKPLHLDVFCGDEGSYGVNSTLIEGETEAILIDAQFHASQAAKLADRIAGKQLCLRAIVITHPDPDHYLGLAALHARFPDAPIYMTAAALEEFTLTSGRYLTRQKTTAPAETPDSLPSPEVLPRTELLVDGESVEVIKDFQGDVLKPTNSFLWIPSIRAVIAGDLVFNGVHPWLADSDTRTRAAWLHSLDFINALHPRVVVAGHKKNAALPDSPDAIAFTRNYLQDFEAARKTAPNADALAAVIKRRYPDLSQGKFADYAAKAAYAGSH